MTCHDIPLRTIGEIESLASAVRPAQSMKKIFNIALDSLFVIVYIIIKSIANGTRSIKW